MSQKEEYEDHIKCIGIVCGMTKAAEGIEAYVSELEAENEKLVKEVLEEQANAKAWSATAIKLEKERDKLRARIEGSPKVWVYWDGPPRNNYPIKISKHKDSVGNVPFGNFDSVQQVYAVPVEKEEFVSTHPRGLEPVFEHYKKEEHEK